MDLKNPITPKLKFKFHYPIYPQKHSHYPFFLVFFIPINNNFNIENKIYSNNLKIQTF
jgi:hypothetical protein